MTQARFIQIHSLQSYPAALLNRDDSGLAKRLPFGDATRTRISSQCLKRHWRTAEDEWALKTIGPAMAVRSRAIPEARILPALEGVGSEEIRKAVVDAIAVKLYGDNAVKDPRTRQALLLGEPEIAYLTQKARLAAALPDAKSAAAAIETLFKKEEKANLSAMIAAKGTLQAGLEAALFGRMITSDPADAKRGRMAVARRMYALRLGEVLPHRDIAVLRGIEGARMKETYRISAERAGIRWNGRRYDRGNPTAADLPNQALNHASSAIEGAAAIAVAATATIPQLGFVHEDSGQSFVLDIADLVRDTVTIPCAFKAAAIATKRPGRMWSAWRGGWPASG